MSRELNRASRQTTGPFRVLELVRKGCVGNWMWFVTEFKACGMTHPLTPPCAANRHFLLHIRRSITNSEVILMIHSLYRVETHLSKGPEVANVAGKVFWLLQTNITPSSHVNRANMSATTVELYPRISFNNVFKVQVRTGRLDHEFHMAIHPSGCKQVGAHTIHGYDHIQPCQPVGVLRYIGRHPSISISISQR